MLDQLRAKDGGESMPVTIGDFADVDVEGAFSLVFVISNTLFMLTSQEEQVRCFQNVASHLDESGVFLVHAFVPDPSMYDQGPAPERRFARLNLGPVQRIHPRCHEPGGGLPTR